MVRMIDTKSDNGHGPFGSTSHTAGPKRLRGAATVHDNPGVPETAEDED